MKTISSALVCLVCLVLAGCATDSNSPKVADVNLDFTHYRCENDVAFTVKFANDSATINSNRGYEVLYRTAGGLSAEQTVYANPRMRAEFGLGTAGNQAILRYLLQPVVVRCVRD